MNTASDSSPQATPAPSNSAPPPASPKPLSIRVIGVGGAGGNAIAHMATTDLRELRLIALHTSSRILEITQAPEKFLLGAALTQGLGAGGDPSLARAAAEHDATLLKDICQGADILFIVAGLGGGTGTGAAPVLARLAKESGSLVLGVVTLPFDLEGPRRRRQAQQGLEELKAAADGVICLANQKIFRIVDENTTILESLRITNELLGQGIRGIWQMLTGPSLIHVDFADLCAVLRDRHSESSFAAVEAQGEGRAREIVDQLLACPLLDGGRALAEAEAVLVNVLGGPDLSMAEVKRIMEEINRRLDNAQLIMGASIAEHRQGRIGLILVASRRHLPEPADSIPASRMPPSPSEPGPVSAPELENRLLEPSSHLCSGSRFTAPPPELTPDRAAEVRAREGRNGPGRVRSALRLQQAHLPLEIVAKGRFEKSQPTIHRGEDLDVPTYIRRGIPLN